MGIDRVDETREIRDEGAQARDRGQFLELPVEMTPSIERGVCGARPAGINIICAYADAGLSIEWLTMDQPMRAPNGCAQWRIDAQR